MKDKLASIFALQLKLQKRVALEQGQMYPPVESRQLMGEILVSAYALCEEIHEATAETGWKPWASSNHINHEAYKAELVDAFHFFINLCILGGITPEELYKGYVEKNRINHERQNNGYTGVKEKCPSCHRAYDDPAVGCFPATPGHNAICYSFGAPMPVYANGIPA